MFTPQKAQKLQDKFYQKMSAEEKIKRNEQVKINKKYFFSLIIIVCFILIGGILISLYLNKKNTTLSTVQEKLREIKSVYAEESLKVVSDKFLKGEMREEDYTSNYSFVFPDKKQIWSYSQMMGNEESIVIGDDIYQKFPIYIGSENKPSFVWVHAKDGEYIRYAGDEGFSFTLIEYPEGWDFTKKLDKIEEDLGVEEVNGVKSHHYKVKVKKLTSEDINSYFFRSILRSDLTEEDITAEGNSIDILEQEGDKIRYVKNGKEMLIPIPNYESITIPFKVIEVKPSKVIEAEPLEVVIGAKPTKVTGAEKTYDFYIINTHGIEGEIWVGEEDYFVYKEKYTIEYTSFFFYPDESEQENKDYGLVLYNKYIHEVNYFNFNKEIKIEPPNKNVKEIKDFETYLQSLEETNSQPSPIDRCVLSSPLSCEEYSISQSDGVKLVIKNGMGDSIQMSSIVITNCGSNNNGGLGWTIEDGAVQNIILKCTPTLTSGNNFAGDITVNYKKTGGKINLITTGILRGKVST